MSEDHAQRKGLFRARNVVLLTVLALVVLIVYAIAWALTARPNPTVDYAAELTALSGASQPPGENGWTHLVKAGELCQQITSGLRGDPANGQAGAFDFSALLDDQSSAESVQTARDALTRLRENGAFAELAAAAKCPNAVRQVQAPQGGPLLTIALPEIGQFRQLAGARAVTLRQAINAGDFVEANAAFEQILMIAGALTHQTTLIDHMVGHSIASLAMTQLRAALVDHHVDEAALNGFQRILDERTPLGSMSLAFDSERRFTFDIIQRTFTNNGRGDGVFLQSEMDSMGLVFMANATPLNANQHTRLFNLSGIALASRKENVEAVNEFYDNLVRQSRLSRADRLKDEFLDFSFIQSLGWRFPLLAIMLPAVGAAVKFQDSTACQIAGTRIMLALEAYRARNGNYPSALNELTPDILAQLPIDPLSPNGEFKYRLLSTDASGPGFVLYSVGADGQDNGGTAAPKPNEALDPGQGKGFDFVFNPPHASAVAPTSNPASR